MNSPFVFDVTGLVHSSTPQRRSLSGPSPVRIGAAMIAVEEGEKVSVEAMLTPLGTGVLVDAQVQAPLRGQCVRCLAPLHQEGSFHINQFFTDSADLITGEGEEDEEDIPQIVDDRVDIQQAVTDEVGLNLPFNPSCPDGCAQEEAGVPAPDGVSGQDEGGLPDPRWAGLEKFL
ncbi:DUF177 domain-containing protein [Corynebacterium sp. zg-331]|uniref:YceD family protein n=1 Tax=unclassified Corynebacterium TaxID=2624378 RepID=UPI00128CA9E7|nr:MULTISPECIES: YceD family protein [unclassified Corynebacterium]MBC3185284.1 DUF177 domain-containing protein [Corynebacterium sp. zg-331]MPV51781.1 DUF177 domain-containing protein [Corynebacterium sp. zg331]